MRRLPRVARYAVNPGLNDGTPLEFSIGKTKYLYYYLNRS